MRRAVLIAASRFEAASDFPALRFTVRDAERFRDVLANPQLCGFERVALLPDQPTAAARRALEKEARDSEPGDLLLFYYSGHGRLDRDGALALVMPESDPEYLGATSLISDELKRLFNLSRASQKVMILDCCYSGAAGAQGFKGSLADSIQSMAQQFSGSFLLTASRRFERAWELEEEQAGALTGALVEGVTSGNASTSASDHVTLAELAAYARRSMVAGGVAQQPEYWDNGGIGGLHFSKKPARFDRAWARRVRAMVNRLVANRILDEHLADNIRDAINLREDPRYAAEVALVDRLQKKEIEFTAFLRAWSQVDRPAAPPPPPPPRPPRPPPDNERREAGGEKPPPAGDAAADGDSTLPPPPPAKGSLEPLIWFLLLVAGLLVIGFIIDANQRPLFSDGENAADENASDDMNAAAEDMQNAAGNVTDAAANAAGPAYDPAANETADSYYYNDTSNGQ